jgi:hypothetical protein
MPTTFLKNPLLVSGIPAAATSGGGAQPANTMTVEGTTGQETTGSGQTAGDGANVSITAGAGGVAPSGSINGAGGSVTINPGAPGAGGGTAATYGNVLLATTGGNIGVGTTTPAEKLHITGSDVAIKMRGTSTDWLVQTVDGNGRFRIVDETNNAERLTILGNGNVGIGTNAPSAKLQVAGAAVVVGNLQIAGTATVDANLGVGTNAPTERIHLVGADPAFRLQGTGSGAKDWLFQAVDSNGRFRIFSQSHNVARFTILDNGNTGIGTATPGSTLHVGGSVQVGAPADGDKGTGSINIAGDFYRNGTPLLAKLEKTISDLTKRIGRLEAALSKKPGKMAARKSGKAPSARKSAKKGKR